ncbi:hypothetical protein TEQG_07555 [Trichophyton equinum CBS 127.97]|uniref:Uncharacterized protein n=1 Tax=Trichophyton equinum (strain ATCC MYA-4606 / CBS 127.97) TaxID=559882 RepID=F2Q3C0_TRIEC|nr:hypothetical protein TEQG_07555 [Trichophyton equinum CBS 127.97]
MCFVFLEKAAPCHGCFDLVTRQLACDDAGGTGRSYHDELQQHHGLKVVTRPSGTRQYTLGHGKRKNVELSCWFQSAIMEGKRRDAGFGRSASKFAFILVTLQAQAGTEQSI